MKLIWKYHPKAFIFATALKDKRVLKSERSEKSFKISAEKFGEYEKMTYLCTTFR